MTKLAENPVMWDDESDHHRPTVVDDPKYTYVCVHLEMVIPRTPLCKRSTVLSERLSKLPYFPPGCGRLAFDSSSKLVSLISDSQRGMSCAFKRSNPLFGPGTFFFSFFPFFLCALHCTVLHPSRYIATKALRRRTVRLVYYSSQAVVVGHIFTKHAFQSRTPPPKTLRCLGVLQPDDAPFALLVLLLILQITLTKSPWTTDPSSVHSPKRSEADPQSVRVPIAHRVTYGAFLPTVRRSVSFSSR